MNKIPKDDAPALEWALFYASLGWAVFPIQPKTKASFYSYPQYKNPETGNTRSWQYQATKDPQRIEIFWTEHPDANIGVATGEISQLYVLDLDREKPGSTQDGRKHFIEWQKKRGERCNVENTPVSVTGSGGNQIFYTCDKPLFNNAAQIYKGYGVDRRGDGGFCVLPPSIHPNGKKYAWKNSPTRYSVHRPNIAAVEYMSGLPAPEHEPIEYNKGYELPGQITEGGRTTEMIRFVGSLVGKWPTLDDEYIKRLVIDENGDRCKPPLTAQELSREVFPAIQRYKSREPEKETPITDPAEYQRLSVANYIDTFWDDPANLAIPIPTGYKRLDDQLGGGLYTGLYVLGAISTIGKTTFALQMANQMAQAGRDILFYSLEMSRAELIAKSISYLTAIIEATQGGQGVAEAINTGGLRNAQTHSALTDPNRFRNYTETEQRLVTAAKELYKKEYGGRIWIIEGGNDTGVEEIKKQVERHKELTGNTPIIFVDYLQILRSSDPRLSDKQRVDENVVELRRVARAHNTVVFAISSLNRASYSQSLDMNAFKESGAIEYGSDGLLGIQPLDMDDTSEKSNLVKETKRAKVRKLELRILKNRRGKADGTQQFLYTPALNVFEDVENDPKNEKERQTRQTQHRTTINDLNDKINALLQKAGVSWLSEGIIPVDDNPFLDNELKSLEPLPYNYIDENIVIKNGTRWIKPDGDDKIYWKETTDSMEYVFTFDFETIYDMWDDYKTLPADKKAIFDKENPHLLRYVKR